MDKHIEMTYCRFEAFKVLAMNYLDITEHDMFGEIQQLLEEVDMSPADVAEHLMLPMSSSKDDSPETCLVDLVEALKKAKALEALKKAKALEAIKKAKALAADDAKAKANEKADAAAKPKEDEEGKKDDDDDTSDLLARAIKVVLERAQQAETGASNEWVLDTYAVFHYTGNLELLAVVGECGGSVQTERFKLPDVRYIEVLPCNIVSVAQLSLRGLVTVFVPRCAYVRDLATGQDVGRAHLSNGKYVLDYLLVQQLNESSVQAQRQGEAGGSCGGGGGGIGGSDGGKERKGGDGGGSGGTAGGQGRGAGAAGEGHDEGREEERDDSGSGGQDGDDEVEELEESSQFQVCIFGQPRSDRQDGDDEVEELEESSQFQVGIFGQPRSDRVTTARVFATSTNEPSGRRREFYMDSGAEHHLTWNKDVLLPYPQELGISTAIESISGVCRGSELRVEGIGYVHSDRGSLDRVLLVPDSDFNLVSVSQLTKEYSAKVSFYPDKMWIDRIETGERIGEGYRVGGHYALDCFDAECQVQQYLRASRTLMM